MVRMRAAHRIAGMGRRVQIVGKVRPAVEVLCGWNIAP